MNVYNEYTYTNTHEYMNTYIYIYIYAHTLKNLYGSFLWIGFN